MSMDPNSESAELPEGEIAARAYERWIRRGRPIGDGLEDWFGARADIEAERACREHDQEVAIYDA